MIFHWLTDNGRSDGMGAVSFGDSLKGLAQHPTKPDYVTIGRAEIEVRTLKGTMTEKQLMMYFKQVKRALNVGGKIYIEATLAR